jgi:endonuclease/exonuclease/phosphatase family metal-dependent hydrolase
VGAAAPVLAIAFVVLVAWFSSWAFSTPGDPSTRAPEAPSGSTAAGTPGAGSTGDDEAAAEGGSGETGEATAGEGTTGDAGDDEALEESVRRFREAQRRLAERVTKRLERRLEPLVFRVATFNVLGDSHTGPGGRAGYPDAGPRMDMAISALRNNSIDVVGFQEFESTQHAMFTARAGEYSLYPGMSLGNKSVRFNIAWRSSMWRLVEAHTLSIPYAGGSRIAMPVVLLESTTNGRRAWFANFHNPADTPNLGNNARWRAQAAGIEIAHLTALHQEDGTPVIVTGDFNERAEIFCRFTAGGVFSAAAGGSTGGGCAPPPSMQVDWIFGSTGVAFDGYAVTDTARASDHGLVHAQATLTEVE